MFQLPEGHDWEEVFGVSGGYAWECTQCESSVFVEIEPDGTEHIVLDLVDCDEEDE